MTAQELANLGVCGAGNALGTNIDNGCADILKAAHSIWLVSPSLVIAEDEDITLTYIQTLQAQGKLVILQGVNTFEENGSDDAVETLADDTMITTNEGKYKFMATFVHGMYFQIALGSVRGYGNWRTMYVDKEGKILLTENATGGFKGFKTNEIKRSKLSMPSNSESMKQGLEFQLTERFEMDDYPVVWYPENLGFDPRQVEPITQVHLELVNAPADTDTTLTIKATFRRGKKDAFSGAAFGDWLATANGATSNPTAGDDSVTEGTYILTVSALVSGQTGSIKLYDNGNNRDVVTVDGSLFKSNTLTWTVSA